MSQITAKQPFKKLSVVEMKAAAQQRDGELSDYVFGKVQPQAIPIEEAVLGAAMLDKEAMNIIVDIIKVSTFYKPQHGTIYEAILRLYKKSYPVDLLTVTDELKKAGKLDEIGGGYYLVEMTNRVGSSANIEYHARILVQMAILREMIEMCSTTIKKCFDGSYDAFEVAEELGKELLEMLNFSTEAKGMGELVSMSLKQFEAWTKASAGLVGIPSGLTALDRITQGWQPEQVITVGARPGMGKTAFVMKAALSSALSGYPVAIFSLEMSSTSLSNRMIALESEVSSSDIKRRRVTDVDWQNIHSACNRVSDLPIFIDDTPAITIMELRAKARRLKQQHDIQLLIIDYLQLMSGGESGGKGNRELEISTISRGLKGLAKELKIPIIDLSQLSRALETRGGTKRPILSDLRESGSIEQDSDVVIFLYRPEYYQIMEDENGDSLKGVAEIIVAKNRDGALDTAKVRFIDRLAKFDNIEDEQLSFPDESPADPYAVPFEPSKVMTVPSKRNDDEDIPF